MLRAAVCDGASAVPGARGPGNPTETQGWAAGTATPLHPACLGCLFVPAQTNEAVGLGLAEPELSRLQESQMRAQPELGQKGRKDRRTSAAHHPHPSLVATCGRQGWEGSLCAMPLSIRAGTPLQKRGCWCWEAAGAAAEQEQRSREHPQALRVPREPQMWLSTRQGLGRGTVLLSTGDGSSSWALELFPERAPASPCRRGAGLEPARGGRWSVLLLPGTGWVPQPHRCLQGQRGHSALGGGLVPPLPG